MKIKHFFVVAGTSSKTKGMDIEKGVEYLEKTKDEIRIEVFHNQDLKFNLLKHDLVPEHIPLTEKEKE